MVAPTDGLNLLGTAATPAPLTPAGDLTDPQLKISLFPHKLCQGEKQSV